MEYTASVVTGIVCCSIGALLLPLLPLLSWLKKQGYLASFLKCLLEWRKRTMSDSMLLKYFHNHRESRLWRCPVCSYINAPSEYSFEAWPRNITEIEWAACNCGREFNLKWNWRTMRLDVGSALPRNQEVSLNLASHHHSDADSGETIRLQTTELVADVNFPPSERSGEGIAETQGMSSTFVQHWEEPEEEEFNIQKDWTCAECNTVHPLSKTEQEQIIGQLKIAKRARLTKQCSSCNTKVHIRIEETDKIDGIMDASGIRSFRFYCGNCKTECEYKIRRAELIGIDHRSIDYRCRKCGAKLGITLQRPRQDKNEWIVKVLWCHSPKQEFERRINERAKRKVKF